MAVNSSNEALVTVVMPVFNGESYLASAIDSMLSQDFTRWRLIVVDDCSTDRSPDIVAQYNDERIHTFRMESNGGIARALNAGIARADTRFIARLDQDDISYPSRLSRQVQFLEENPHVALLGTWAQFFGADTRKVKPPIQHGDLLAELLWRNPFVHSSVMFRREIVDMEEGPYNSAFTGCEDYDLWQRVSLRFGVANLPEMLTKHRLHENQMTAGAQAKSREIELRTIIAYRHRVTLGFNSGSSLLPPIFLMSNLGFFFTTRKKRKISRSRLLAAFVRWVSRNLASLVR